MTDIQIRKLTGDDLLAMSEDEITGMELIDGVLVPMEGEMSPTSWGHGKVEFRFATVFGKYEDDHKDAGEFVTGEVGFYTRGNDFTTRAADIAFIRKDRLPESAEGFSRVAPDLVVEIISPGNSAADMEEKVAEWFAFGVKLIWLVYPKTKRIHVFTSPKEMHIYTAEDTLTGGNVLPDFSCKVSAIFS